MRQVGVTNKPNILACFVSSHASLRNPKVPVVNPEEAKGDLFRGYIWGEAGICEPLKKLNHVDYGTDLMLILFKFYINPVPYLRKHLPEMERYRRNEKAIGVPIVVNDDNFFDQADPERRNFLKQVILQKMDLLKLVVQRNKLDTNIDKLKSDIEQVLQ